MADEELNFLQKVSEERLRREIVNICDSYSHPWDSLAELCQNAVDAIRAHQRDYPPREHRIEILVDSTSRTMRVTDTGVGFNISDLASLLAPHGTDKSDPSLIGEKGVGLTYTIFMCDRYEMSTRSETGSISGHVDGGASWRRGHQQDLPAFVQTAYSNNPVGPDDSGTTITMADVAEDVPDDHSDLFRQRTEVLEYWLRTNTAIGSLGTRLRDESFEIQVQLVHKKPDDPDPDLIEIEFEYMWPHLLVDNCVELEEAKSRLVSLNDAQTARYLAGKALVKNGEFERAGRKIRYNAFFAPERALWDEVSEKNNLQQVDADGNVINLASGGIYLGTKGMPTGITVDPPQTGLVGYWPNFHILLEDDSLAMDLGRKSVPGRTKGMLRELAREIFNDFRPVATKATRSPTVTSSIARRLSREKEFERLEGLSDLAFDAIRYAKHPDEQEAAVVAIFHELIGAGILRGYRIGATGYKRTYDAWGWYDLDHDGVGSNRRAELPDDVSTLPIVIEHKFRAESILRDFQRNRKFLGDLDLVVCWDLDESRFGRELVTVSALHEDDVLFDGSNYRLSWAAAYALGDLGEMDVLSLRRLLQNLSTETT